MDNTSANALPTAGDVSGPDLTAPDGQGGAGAENRGLPKPWRQWLWTARGGSRRLLTGMTGVGLEPTTNGLTYRSRTSLTFYQQKAFGRQGRALPTPCPPTP